MKQTLLDNKIMLFRIFLFCQVDYFNHSHNDLVVNYSLDQGNDLSLQDKDNHSILKALIFSEFKTDQRIS